ncbi:MAG: gfo/Idh/MocA family oxidoreductase, partial [Halorhabdus sp.]
MRFGILSTASIARTALIPAIERSEHEVTAIASRDADRAATVAADLGIPNAYGGYDEMLTEA